jgi:predicted AAA+ superfamily ATPase
MYRKKMSDLNDWKTRSDRKPLIIRGARQVGKTWLVREFARIHFENFIEINFDKTPNKTQLFKSRDIEKCLQLLEIDTDTEIIPGRTLLFFDEIQAGAEVLPLLRYFFEERPDLHVIAAGSLLEFLLTDHDFSMPVGRVEYLHMGPMDFDEFLLGLGQDRLFRFLTSFTLQDSIPESIHDTLMYYVQLFWVIGGMPAAIQSYGVDKKINAVGREHESILQTYEDDFSKYRRRIYPQRLRKVFRRLPALIGRKLKYVNIDPNEKSKDLAHTLHLLELARIYFPVKHSAGNGIPLGAEAKDRDFKPLYLDIGLAATSLGINLADLQMEEELIMINNGAMAEQFIGQHLLYKPQSYKRPELYYWNREKKSSQAEVDYLISCGSKVVPVEVKAGKTGSLKSLQVFISEKKSPLAVRFNSMEPSTFATKSSIAGKESVNFVLISLPMYLVCQLDRLLETFPDRDC